MKVVALVYNEETWRVLSGFESYYCFEKSGDVYYNSLIDRIETCNEEEAIWRSIMLSKLFGIEIRYTEFINHRTHYSCMTTNSHLGLIKGNVDKGELPEDAMIRELYEEVGIIIPKERLILHRLPSSVRVRQMVFFMIPVTFDEEQQIMNQVEERRKRHCGELFKIGFRDLVNDSSQKNQITSRVSDWLSKIKYLPRANTVYPIKMGKLLPVMTDETMYPESYIIEPPFVWNQVRFSLLPLPLEIC